MLLDSFPEQVFLLPAANPNRLILPIVAMIPKPIYQGNAITYHKQTRAHGQLNAKTYMLYMKADILACTLEHDDVLVRSCFKAEQLS